MSELLEAYLDELAGLLRALPGRDLRRALAEADDHLRASTDLLVEKGADPVAAADESIRLFGDPTTVARQFVVDQPAALAALARDAVRKLAVVAVAGLLVVGFSGATNRAIGAAAGKAFVAGDGAGVTYTPQRCADFRAFHPRAATCADAATAHHFDEIVGGREDLGLLGLVGLGVLVVLGRRGVLSRWRTSGPLPRTFGSTVGAALFGVGGLALTGLAVMSIAFGQRNGAGAMLSDGLVSVAAFGVAVWRLVVTARS